MKRTVEIDGSMGEGGGQIVRSALALSIITNASLRIYNVRASRRKPGLQPQHLMALKAAAEICRASVSGADIGSTELSFTPGPVRPGHYKFTIGTAGSTALVFQTVCLPLMLASGNSEVLFEGGTHNRLAPSFDFLEHTFVPILQRMGAQIRLDLKRPGFYPAGGGAFTASIVGTRSLGPLKLTERGPLVRRSAKAVVSSLPVDIARREVLTVRQRLGLDKNEVATEEVTSPRGPGNVLTITIESQNITEVFTGIGEKGKPAEKVAAECCSEAARYLESGAAVGEHLADQLLLPCALAGNGSFTTLEPSSHFATNCDVLARFIDLTVSQKCLGGDYYLVSLKRH